MMAADKELADHAQTGGRHAGALPPAFAKNRRKEERLQKVNHIPCLPCQSSLDAAVAIAVRGRAHTMSISVALQYPLPFEPSLRILSCASLLSDHSMFDPLALICKVLLQGWLLYRDLLWYNAHSLCNYFP